MLTDSQNAFNAGATVACKPEHEVDAGSMSQQELAELLHPKRHAWKLKYTGKKGSARGTQHKQVNWMLAFLFQPIQAAADMYGYKSADAIVRYCCNTNANIYRHLHKGTVQKWLNVNCTGWKDRAVKKIAQNGNLTGSGQAGALAKYPALVDKIKLTLLGIRGSSISVN
jgi:hypothetical protein